MSARDAILNRIRAKTGGNDTVRAKAVADRLKDHPQGVIPARAALPPKEKLALFIRKAEEVQTSVVQVKAPGDVAKAVAAYLREKNLPSTIRMGADKRFAAMGFDKQKALEVKTGASDGDDLTGFSHALGGIAETGTLLLTSGADNPTTLNFLPEYHIVVIEAGDVDGTMEEAFGRLRTASKAKGIARAVNLVTGPSRSGDIEQKIILGAHGPKSLHVIIVGKA